MSRFLSLVVALFVPLPALASVPPEDVVAAMDVDLSLVVSGSIEAPGSSPGMFDAVADHGVIDAWTAPMAMLYTGSVDVPDWCEDHDWPGAGMDGDHVTLTFQLQVPDTASSIRFYSYFLSREYPEWVGSKYNDVYQVTLEGDAYTGSIVFDGFGNPVTVNSALFAVTDPALLAGTCFESDGGTGWVQTVAPVTPGDVIRLTLEIWDEADGIFDSMVLVDGFEFSEDEVEEPETVGEEPLRLAFVSPKEGPLEGGGDVTLHGAGFGENTEVWWDGVRLEGLVLGTGGETIRLQGIPGSAEPRSVSVEVVEPDAAVLLEDAFTYHADSEGAVPPTIVRVSPGTVATVGGSRVDVVGSGFAPDAEVWIAGVDLAQALVLERVEQGDGWRVSAELPPHPEGWVDLLVVNPDGAASEPGYPLLYSDDVGVPGVPPRDHGPGCAVQGRSAPGLALLLLLLLGLTRAGRAPAAAAPPRPPASRAPGPPAGPPPAR